jgi:hypothetical protein
VAKQESLWRGSLNGKKIAKNHKRKNTSPTTSIDNCRSRVVLVEEENNLEERSEESSDVDEFLNFYHPCLSVEDRRKKLQH